MTLTLICFATAKKKSFLSNICLFVLVNVKIDYVGHGFFYDGFLGSVIPFIAFPAGSVKPLEIRLLKYFF